MRVREEEGHCHACMRCGIYPIAGVRVFLAGARASLRTPQLRFSVVLLLLASFFFFLSFFPPVFFNEVAGNFVLEVL